MGALVARVDEARSALITLFLHEMRCCTSIVCRLKLFDMNL